jgi:hypothetical protein
VKFLNQVNICPGTYDNWVEKYPRFTQAHKMAEPLAYDWWIDLGLQNCDNENWDNTVWKYTMNTRFKQFTMGVKIEGFKNLTNAKEQHKCVLDAASDSLVDPKNAKLFTDLIEAGQRIESNSDLLSRIEALEKRGVT